MVRVAAANLLINPPRVLHYYDHATMRGKIELLSGRCRASRWCLDGRTPHQSWFRRRPSESAAPAVLFLGLDPSQLHGSRGCCFNRRGLQVDKAGRCSSNSKGPLGSSPACRSMARRLVSSLTQWAWHTRMFRSFWSTRGTECSKLEGTFSPQT